LSQHPWTRFARLAVSAILSVAPVLGVAQDDPEEDIWSQRTNTLHGCYRFVCLSDQLEVIAAARSVSYDPEGVLSWWSASRYIQVQVDGTPYMIDVADEPGRFVGREPYYTWETRCCSAYTLGPDGFFAGALHGENGTSSRDEVLGVVARPLGTTATFFLYTPRPGTTPPAGATDLRPYSIKYTITIGEHGLVRGVSSVPEPATLALTAGGMLALSVLARRRRR
jgi:hypothetical protein